MPPIKRRAVTTFFSQLSNDSGSGSTGGLELQDGSRRQACGRVVSMLQCDEGASNQSPLLPARVEIVPAPEDCDQENNGDQRPQKELQIETLCSLMRRFHYHRLRDRSSMCNLNNRSLKQLPFR